MEMVSIQCVEHVPGRWTLTANHWQARIAYLPRQSGSIACQHLARELIGSTPTAKWGGRPWHPGSPWFFSWSHAPPWYGVLVSAYPAGIDIQPATPRLQKVAPRIAHPGDDLSQLPATVRPLCLWVTKEAAYKAGGAAGYGLWSGQRILIRIVCCTVWQKVAFWWFVWWMPLGVQGQGICWWWYHPGNSSNHQEETQSSPGLNLMAGSLAWLGTLSRELLL